MNVFRAIRGEARNWWYFQKLRKQGDHAEAKKREIHETRLIIKSIRKIKYIHIGRGGHTVWYSADHRLEGYKSDINNPYLQYLIARGIAILDTTTVPDVNLVQLARISMIALPPVVPENKFGALNYESLKYVASEYKKLGATIYNVKGVSDE